MCCVNVEVTLPAVKSFLFNFTLYTGSVVTLLYTALRSFLLTIFYIVAMLEILVQHPQGSLFTLLVPDGTPPPDTFTVIYLYCNYIALMYCEGFLLVGCLFLCNGLLCSTTNSLEYYLIVRFLTWVVQVVCLIMLSVGHKPLMNWYLIMLMLVVLDVYLFIVVYSYFVAMLLTGDPPAKEPAEEDD